MCQFHNLFLTEIIQVHWDILPRFPKAAQKSKEVTCFVLLLNDMYRPLDPVKSVKVKDEQWMSLIACGNIKKPHLISEAEAMYA